MGKQPVKLKAVVYALSPFQQKVMAGIWKDLPEKIHHKVSENWISATLLLTPVIGTYCMHNISKNKRNWSINMNCAISIQLLMITVTYYFLRFLRTII